MLEVIQHVLVMTVNPGFGGQKFIAGSEQRIQQVRALLEGHPVTLGVDGGITPTILGGVVKAGVSEVVAGSSVFNPSPIQDNVRALKLGLNPL